MCKNILLFVLMLVSSLLAGQPDRSPAAVKANDDFNRFIVEELKAQKFSSLYKHLEFGFDTLKLGQTLSRYAFHLNKPEYKVVSVSQGWAGGADNIYRAMYSNSWKINEEEKFSIQLFFHKTDNSFVIDLLNFYSSIPELFSREKATIDSLNKVVRNAIIKDDYITVYNLVNPAEKIDKAELKKTIHAYSSIIADTSLSFYDGSDKSAESFPSTNKPWYCMNHWEIAHYVMAATIDMTIVYVNGKYVIEKIEFMALDKKTPSVAFPGGIISSDLMIPPPPPPPPMPR